MKSALVVSSDMFCRILAHSYHVMTEHEDQDILKPRSRLEYLADNIFDFTTYDSEISELLAKEAVKVCRRISGELPNTGLTFEESTWHAVMCNMPFFHERIDYGTSIRTAWWSIEGANNLSTSGVYVEYEQVCNLIFGTNDSWKEFVSAVCEFSEER